MLYKKVDYNKPNVEVLNNEVILSLTWNAIVLQKASLLMNEITDYGYINKAEVDNMSYDEGAVNVSIPKEKMNEYVKEVFGSEIKYVDDDIPLNMEYIRPFGPTLFESLTTDSIVSYSNETYQSRYLMGGGTGYPYILEDVKEIQKYEDYVEIYVKTSFVDIEPHDNAPSTNRIYKEFDSKTNEFVNALGVYKTDEDYEKIKNKLHTFLYTYKIDKETGEYYLASFTLNE